MSLCCYYSNMAKPKKDSIDDLLGDAPPKNVPAPSQHSAEVQQALAALPTKKAKFVLNVAAGMVPADALVEAGWECSRKTATSTAGRLLREDEQVKDALNIIKADLALRAEYSFNSFIAEMDSAMEFARETKNATALVRAIELKGKASGHIVERVDQRNMNAGFQLMVTGVEPPKAGNG